MVFKIDDVCSKCGKSAKDFPGKVWSFRIGPPVVCYICEPPPLEGSCPTCEGHGQVNLFDVWSTLNQVMCDQRSRFDVLREELPKCRTKAEAKALLAKEQFDTRYPLLPEWLPD